MSEDMFFVARPDSYMSGASFFFFSSRRRHTRLQGDWSSDVCSSDLLSPFFVAQFPNRILNIHPSLLPSFPGLESQRQALEYGVKFAGCTVHFVDENLDAGPIVIQAVVAVEDQDTEESLSARILKEEHRVYSQAVKIVLEEKYKMVGRRVLRSEEHTSELQSPCNLVCR